MQFNPKQDASHLITIKKCPSHSLPKQPESIQGSSMVSWVTAKMGKSGKLGPTNRLQNYYLGGK